MDQMTIVDNILEVYLNNEEEYKCATDTVRQIVKEDLRKDIIDEVWKLKQDEIIEDTNRKVKEEKEIRKREQVKVVILETLFLGCLIGLLVNQGTDIITTLKGGSGNIGMTLLIIAILLILSTGFAFLIYLDKLDEFFNKR